MVVFPCVCATDFRNPLGLLASVQEEAELWKMKFQEQVKAFAAAPNGDGAHGEPHSLHKSPHNAAGRALKRLPCQKGKSTPRPRSARRVVNRGDSSDPIVRLNRRRIREMQTVVLPMYS